MIPAAWAAISSTRAKPRNSRDSEEAGRGRRTRRPPMHEISPVLQGKGKHGEGRCKEHPGMPFPCRSPVNEINDRFHALVFLVACGSEDDATFRTHCAKRQRLRQACGEPYHLKNGRCTLKFLCAHSGRKPVIASYNVRKAGGNSFYLRSGCLPYPSFPACFA